MKTMRLPSIAQCHMAFLLVSALMHKLRPHLFLLSFISRLRLHHMLVVADVFKRQCCARRSSDPVLPNPTFKAKHFQGGPAASTEVLRLFDLLRSCGRCHAALHCSIRDVAVLCRRH